MNEQKLNTSKGSVPELEPYKSQQQRNWLRPQAESNIKRMQLRKKIRQKQISELFNEKRKKFRLLQTINQHRENNENVSLIGTQGYQGADKNMRQTYQQTVDELLHSYKCDSLAVKKVCLSSDVIRKIWRIVLDSADQICVSQPNMELLIDSAKTDLLWLQHHKTHSQLKNSQLSQRIGQIMWILLNQCYKSPQISIGTATKIISLCICCLKKPRPDSLAQPDSSPFKTESTDQYLTGLCIILLGNICVSQEHVYCIIKQIKISELVYMIDGKLETDNYQDLSFFIANLLYYYPLPHIISNAKGVVRAREQQLELMFVLQYLYRNLDIDLLLHLYTLQNMKSRNTTPQKLNTKAQSISKQKSKKSQYSHSLLNELYQEQGIKKFSLQLSDWQVNKLSWQQSGKSKSHISQNFTNDLMQCIGKTKQLLSQLACQIKKMEQVSQSQSQQYASQANLNELKVAHSRIRQVIEKQYQFNVIVNAVRVIAICGGEHPYLARLTYFYHFLKAEFRGLGVGAHFGNHAHCKQGHKATFNKDKFVIQLIDIGACQKLLICIRKLQKNWRNWTSQLPQADKQLSQSLQNSMWEVYQRLLLLLLEASTTTPLTSTIRKAQVMLASEISYLQSQIFTQKQNHCDWENKILTLLGECYPIINVNEVANQRAANSRRGTLRLSEIQSQNSIKSNNTTVEYIEIDMQKICELINLMCMKLLQYSECTTMLLLCLQSIQTIIKRLNLYLSDFNQEKEYSKISQILLSPHIQKQLRQLSCQHLYSDSGLSNEICDVIQQILYGKKQQQLIEMEEQQYQTDLQEQEEGSQMGYSMHDIEARNGEQQSQDQGK